VPARAQRGLAVARLLFNGDGTREDRAARLMLQFREKPQELLEHASRLRAWVKPENITPESRDVALDLLARLTETDLRWLINFYGRGQGRAVRPGSNGQRFESSPTPLKNYFNVRARQLAQDNGKRLTEASSSHSIGERPV